LGEVIDINTKRKRLSKPPAFTIMVEEVSLEDAYKMLDKAKPFFHDMDVLIRRANFRLIKKED
jgi:hypothetical protein